MSITGVLKVLTAVLVFAGISSADALKTGAVLSLTGNLSFMGQDMRDGMILCSKNGGILFEDHQSSAVTGLNAFLKLMDRDGVNFGVVSFSNVASAIIPVAQSRKVPLILTVVSSTAVAKRGGEGVVNFFTTGEQDGALLGGFLASQKEYRNAAILYLEGEYGQSYAEAFSKAFRTAGGSVSSSETFQKDQLDYRPNLLKIKAARADILYIIGFDQHIPIIWKQAKEIQLKARLASNWTLSSPQLRGKDRDVYEGAVFTSPLFYLTDSGRSGSFKAQFARRFSRPASAYAAIGCDLTGIVDLYGKSGPAKLMESLKALQGYDGVMGRISYAGDNQISFPLYPVELKGEALIPLLALPEKDDSAIGSSAVK